jgi:hypothetical protein
MAVNLDLTITLGTIVETGVIIIGGVAALVTLRSTVDNLKAGLATFRKDTKDQFDGVHSKIATSKLETKQQFDGIQDELKKLSAILIDMARFDERITNLDKRVTSQGRQIDEMRRGEGFIRSGHRASIDGEYGS